MVSIDQFNIHPKSNHEIGVYNRKSTGSTGEEMTQVISKWVAPFTLVPLPCLLKPVPKRQDDCAEKIFRSDETPNLRQSVTAAAFQSTTQYREKQFSVDFPTRQERLSLWLGGDSVKALCGRLILRLD